MPPELLAGGLLGKAADVYAFGVLLWQMWSGSRPWAGMRHHQVYEVGGGAGGEGRGAAFSGRHLLAALGAGWCCGRVQGLAQVGAGWNAAVCMRQSPA
jgi:hypothetical protein